MPQQKKKTNRKKSIQTETDSAFFLKLVVYVVLGSFWLKFATPLSIGSLVFNGLPVGLLLGVLLASHDQFQVDRKIEYAVLIVVTILSYFAPSGILI
jgi:hypothetical protein